MGKEISMVSRRQIIKLSSIFAALPLVSLVKLISPASAAVMVKVPTDDPAAIALKYVEVASAAVRTDKMGVPGSEQTCGNCRFYKDSETPEWGGCTLFQNRLVVKAGWCMGWIPAA
ncbi:MAG: high-potential iron-sulfur protein [Pseudomonadales bacterium]|nr:high-potential iron-sulfur protein [Pseudomonadales bacterium]